MSKWTLRKTYKHDRTRKTNTLFWRAQPSDERYDINSSWVIWELDTSSIIFGKQYKPLAFKMTNCLVKLLYHQEENAWEN